MVIAILLLVVIILVVIAVGYNIPDPIPPNPPIPPPIPVLPGDNVKWMNFPKQQDLSAGSPFLTDILSHLPLYMGNQYYDSDKVTWGHETTHGINSHIRNTFGKSGQAGFYIGLDKAIVLDQPKMTLTDIAKIIPSELRGDRYQLYFINQAGDWDDFPLYVLDEFIAYTNGAAVGLEMSQWTKNIFFANGQTDVMIGPLEFAIYALCTCIAIDQHDPEFLNNVQFKEFVAHELRRSIGIYRNGIVMPPFQWDTKLEQNVRKNSACISILKKMYGDSLTMEILFNDNH